MFQIKRFEFNDNTSEVLLSLRHKGHDVGFNWPVVYIINDKKEAYIGETIHASLRADQHRTNPERKKLTEIRIISDDNFNKSVILDLESFLIRHMHADGRFIIQNGNNGLQDHDYFQREDYSIEFEKIWEKLRKEGVAKHSITEIENSELYKYSPYKSLGTEQIKAELDIIHALSEGFEHNKRCMIVVRGGAGTGKTILAIYLMKIFADVIAGKPISEQFEDEILDEDPKLIYAAENLKGIYRIGLVLPQKSLRTSVKEVFKGLKSLNKNMVLSPAEVVKDYLKTKEQFDLLIIDEAHRLKYKRTGGNLQGNRSFMDTNIALGLDENEGNEIDWMMLCSRNIIFLRDNDQTVRPNDIDGKLFKDRIDSLGNQAYYLDTVLESQWRCEGGEEYIQYLKSVLYQRQKKAKTINNYDFKLFNSCEEMVNAIKRKDKELGLCRVVAGYAWPWNRKKTHLYTIEIQGKKYRWNRTYDNWIQTPTAINEIGCIHTVQGYDLNYTGVIIGEDIKLDSKTKAIYADKRNYYDSLGKAGVSKDPEALKDYLLHIYVTLMSRGIKGTYVYVCDDALRIYLSQFIPVA